MPPLCLGQRFRRNPWPWLIALLLLLLVPLWLRERHVLRGALEETHTFRPGVGLLAGVVIPPFNDPFGNIYWLMGEMRSYSPEGDGGIPSLFIVSYDWEGFDDQRSIVLSHNHLSVDRPLSTRDIPPILFLGLFLIFTILWIRNARCRQRAHL